MIKTGNTTEAGRKIVTVTIGNLGIGVDTAAIVGKEESEKKKGRIKRKRKLRLLRPSGGNMA